MLAIQPYRQLTSCFILTARNLTRSSFWDNKKEGSIHPEEKTIRLFSEEPPLSRPERAPDYFYGGLTALVETAKSLFSNKSPYVVYVNPHLNTETFQSGDYRQWVDQTTTPYTLALNGCWRRLRGQNWAVEHLKFQEHLSKAIKEESGKHVFKKNSIFCGDHAWIEATKIRWRQSGIGIVELSSPSLLHRRALMNQRTQKQAMEAVIQTGETYPDSFERIFHFLKQKFPENFFWRKASISELYVDKTTQMPFAVKEVAIDGKSHLLPVRSVFAHSVDSETCLVMPQNDSQRQVIRTISFSGIRSFWTCAISEAELQARLGIPDAAQIATAVEELPLFYHQDQTLQIENCRVQEGQVAIRARFTQSHPNPTAERQQRHQSCLAQELNASFCGQWTPLSVEPFEVTIPTLDDKYDD